MLIFVVFAALTLLLAILGTTLSVTEHSGADGVLGLSTLALIVTIFVGILAVLA